MDNLGQTKLKILIIVKTYPVLSTKYKETVCTAGISSDYEWVRLFPIPFRYLKGPKQFRKFDWIEVEVENPTKDIRKESKKPHIDTLNIVGHISTDNKWNERKNIINKMPVMTLKQLTKKYEIDKTSLGIVKPKEILDLKVTRNDKPIKPALEAIKNQQALFTEFETKPHENLPYKFSYIFTCEDSNKPHTAMIEDWELGQLFRKQREKKGSDDEAIKDVKDMYLHNFTDNKDLSLFMGTVHPYNTWVVIGVFYPPK